MKIKPDKFRRIWSAPILLGSATLLGLFAALLGTGPWHLLAWIALAAPLLILIWKLAEAFFPKTK